MIVKELKTKGGVAWGIVGIGTSQWDHCEC